MPSEKIKNLIEDVKSIYGSLPLKKGANIESIIAFWDEELSKYSETSLKRALIEHQRGERGRFYPTVDSLIKNLSSSDLDRYSQISANEGPVDYQEALAISSEWYKKHILGWKEFYRIGFSSVYERSLDKLLKDCLKDMRDNSPDFRRNYKYAHDRDGGVLFSSQLALAWMTKWLPFKYDEYIVKEKEMINKKTGYKFQ